MLITEDTPIPPAALTSYPWPPMSKSVGGALSAEALNSYLNAFYARAADWEHLVASAFPGFNDIYAEAGVGAGYGFLDARDGETFAHTLQIALDNNPDVVQLVTWNDYGEGTNIEPTQEYGYAYLEQLQALNRDLDPGFAFTAADLELPLQIFNLRKQHAGDEAVQAALDEAVAAVLAGDLETARNLLDEMPQD